MKTKLFVLITVIALLLTACAAPAAPAPQPTKRRTRPLPRRNPPNAPKRQNRPRHRNRPRCLNRLRRRPPSRSSFVYLVFESPVLTAEYWDNNIADAIKNAGLEGKVTVKKIVSPGIDRTTYAKQLLASGQLPDIMQSINTQEFIDAGILTPWDSKWIEDNYLIPYGNALQGKVWQAPAGAQIIPFFFYNTEMFEKAGVKPPTNWAEFQDVAKKLKDAGFKPLQLVGGGDAWASSMLPSAFIAADVLGDTPDWVQKRKTGEVKFTDANMAAAWEKYAWLVENGYVDKGDLGIGYADANRAFINGEAAMYPMGSWFLQQAGKEAKFKPGVFLAPRDDGKVVVPFAVGGGTHISAESKHPAEAMAFAQAFNTSPKMLADLIELDSLFPLLKGKKFEDYGVDVTALMKEGMGYVDLPESIRVNGFGWTASDDALIAGMVDEVNKTAQTIITGGDYKAELDRLDKVWDSLAAD